MKGKKYITFIVTAFTILSSCSKELVDQLEQGKEQQRSYIFFEPSVSEQVATKTTILTGESLPTGASFGVLGYHGSTNKTPLFANEITKVYQPAEGSDFKYDGNLAPWKDANEHYFYAFYTEGQEYETSVSAVVANGGAPYINYTQPVSLDEMYDILTAYTPTRKVFLVPLEFQHRLWALDIKITNSQTALQDSVGTEISGPNLKITGVKLSVSNLPASAQIKIAGGETTSGSQNLTFTVSSTPTSVEAKKTSDFGTLLFLPCSTFSYRIEVQYETVTSAGATKTGTFAYPSSGYASATELKAGYRYNLTVNKTNDKFFVGLQPGEWTPQEVQHEFN